MLVGFLRSNRTFEHEAMSVASLKYRDAAPAAATDGGGAVALLPQLTALSVMRLAATPSSQPAPGGQTLHYTAVDGIAEVNIGSSRAAFLLRVGDAPFAVSGHHSIRAFGDEPATVCCAVMVTGGSSSSSNNRGALVAAAGDADDGAAEDERRAGQRHYVHAVRDNLLQTLAFDNDTVRLTVIALHAVRPTEHRARHELLRREAEEREAACRAGLAAEEALCFGALLARKQQAMMVPWCSGGCRYCCMARPRWATHVREVGEQLDDFAGGAEARARRTIAECEQLVFASYLAALSVKTQRDAAHVLQQQLLETEEALRRDRLFDDETAAWERYVRVRWAALMAGVEAAGAAFAVREKHLSILRIQDSLGLRERKSHRKELLVVTGEEGIKRRQLVALEEQQSALTYIKFLEFFAAEKVAAVEAQNEALVLERDELFEWRRTREVDDEEAVRQKERDGQNALEAELKEIRRLKKSGAEKSPPPPVCQKCGLPPIKDLFSHRLNECSQRPVQCARCDRVMTSAEHDEHKDICPSRVVECATCANHYKASYAEGQHHQMCLSVKSAKQLVTTELKPMYPFDFWRPSPPPEGAADGDGENGAQPPQLLEVPPLDTAAGVAICRGADTLAMEAAFGGTAFPELVEAFARERRRVITHLNGVAIMSEEACAATVDEFGVGEMVDVTFLPLPLTPAEQQEADSAKALEDAKRLLSPQNKRGKRRTSAVAIVLGDDAPPDPNVLSVQIVTKAPFSEFKALLMIVHEDESQYVKPAVTKKAKKK
jgi:hypothetical protein